MLKLKAVLMFFLLSFSMLLSQKIELNPIGDLSKINSISREKTSGNILEKITGTFNSDLIENYHKDHSLLKIAGVDFRFRAGEPIVPQKNIHIKLEGYYNVEQVSLLSGNILEGVTKNILKSSSVVKRKSEILNMVPETLLDKSQVYTLDSYYPGKWLTFTAGYDGEFTHVYIHFFPIQWNPVNYKLIFLHEYSIAICGTEHVSNPENEDFSKTNDRHLILSPSGWMTMADSIKQFHDLQGFTSSVINVDDIYSIYEPAEDPSHAGYANQTNTDIQNYNYENAKKIIAYLLDTEAHPLLELVTILGSAEIIPPSYYFYVPVDVVPYYHNYFSWIPSDHYYSSPDYDWIDNFGVTRVSVHSEDDLSNYYHKIVNWNDHLSEDWINNVSVSGGIPCGTNYFLGELCNNHIITEDIFTGFNIQKFQHHLGNYNAASIENHLQNDNVIMHYNDSHGSGRAIYFDDDSQINVNDLLALPLSEKLPVFLSLACMNGNFDTELVNNPWGGGMSFAEAVITSPGAGIAYIGGGRYTTGNVFTELINGNIGFIGQDQLYAILFYYMKAYRNVDEPTLGNLYKTAKDSFLLEQDMEDVNAKVAYVQAAVFGDAALMLPIPPDVSPQTSLPEICADGALVNPADDFQIVNLNNDENPIYNIDDTNLYNLQTVNISGGSVQQTSNICNSFELSNTQGNQLILNKVINEEGKEAWHYSIVNKGLKKIDGNISDWYPHEQIGFDDATDITPDVFDLTSVYAALDEENNTLNFSIPVCPGAEDENYYFIIALDDQESFGLQNNYTEDDYFPFPVYVGFEDATINKAIVIQTNPTDFFESPYEISKYNFYIHYLYNGQPRWYEMQINEGEMCGIAYVSDSLVEISFPADYINVENCKFSVFSSVEGGIMEDVIPSSEYSPSEVLYGPENAYSISSYIDLEEALAIASSKNRNTNKFHLSQNYPNPFNPDTYINYNIPVNSHVKLGVYNILGQKIKSLVNKSQITGEYKVKWDGTNSKSINVGSGIYFYKLETNNFIKIKKMVLLK